MSVNDMNLEAEKKIPTYEECSEARWQLLPSPPPPVIRPPRPAGKQPTHPGTVRSRTAQVADEEAVPMSRVHSCGKFYPCGFWAYLGNIQICLHHEERVQCIRTGRIWVIEKVLDFCEGRLSESSSAVFWWNVRLRVRLF